MWTFIQDQILGMKWLNTIIGKLLLMVGLDVNSRVGGSIQFFIYDTIKITVGGADIFLDFLQGLRKEQCQCTRRSRKRQPLSYTISLDRLLLLFEKRVTLPVKLCIYG